jgi:hypothetical protein
MTSHQDTVLFGSSANQVGDDFGDCVDSALIEGVHSLPMIQSTLSDTMLASLRKAYHRNADIFQAYIQRNVFSIASLSKTRRQQLVQAFMDKTTDTDAPSSSSGNDDDALSDITNTTLLAPAKYPSEECIPKADDMATMEATLGALREELAAAKRRRNEMKTKLDQLTVANSAAGQVQVTDLHSAVTTMIMGKEGLVSLVEQGKEQLEEMDKRQRPEEGDDVDEAPKKVKLSMEAQYAMDKQSTTFSRSCKILKRQQL